MRTLDFSEYIFSMMRRRSVRYACLLSLALGTLFLLCLKRANYFELLTNVKQPGQKVEQLGEQLKKTDQKLGEPSSKFTIESVLRMPSTKKHVGRMLCDFLRTASLYWDASYGPIVLILDKESEDDEYFPGKFLNLKLPFKFRLEFEPSPPNKARFSAVAAKGRRHFGYFQQLYSSFIMDRFVKSSSIAWFDTDIYLTSVITKDRILRDGKLVVKGMNTFQNQSIVRIWDKQTKAFLGFPSVSDFMSYFPAFIYTSTIKNCREFIMKRFKRDKWEEAFVDAVEQALDGDVEEWRIGKFPSPVIILFTYAYIFEHDLYDWHLDLGHESLEKYNQRFVSFPFEVSSKDLSPELHFSIHAAYYPTHVEALTTTICHTYLAKGGKSIPEHCKSVKGTNMLLFEFSVDPYENHFEGWCGGQAGKVQCANMVRDHYMDVSRLLRTNTRLFDTRNIQIIEKAASNYFETKCLTFQY